MADQTRIQRADAQFRKLQRVEDGKKAMSEYEAERAAVRANTERLRALRLARDAALQADAQATPVKLVAKPKPRLGSKAKTTKRTPEPSVA